MLYYAILLFYLYVYNDISLIKTTQKQRTTMKQDLSFEVQDLDGKHEMFAHYFIDESRYEYLKGLIEYAYEKYDTVHHSLQYISTQVKTPAELAILCFAFGTVVKNDVTQSKAHIKLTEIFADALDKTFELLNIPAKAGMKVEKSETDKN